MNTERKIVQIISANGWKAVHALEEGEDLFVEFPVCVWALTRKENGSHKCEDEVVGMTTEAEGYLDFCEDQYDFIGYVGPGEDASKTYSSEVLEFRKRSEKKRLAEKKHIPEKVTR